MKLERRAVNFVDLADFSEVTLTDLPKTVIRLSNGATFDVGALTFAIRAKQRRGGRYGTEVDLFSFDERRIPAVFRFASMLAELLVDGSIRETTLRTLSRVSFAYINWCDAHGHLAAMYEEAAATNAIGSYLHFVRQRHLRSEITSSTGRDLQTQALNVVRYLFDDDEFCSEFNAELIEKRKSTATEPPDEGAHGKTLALAQSLFDGLFAASVGNTPFPYKMKVPQFLTWPSHYIWLFARKQWINPPFLLVDDLWTPNVNWCYDFANGKLKEATALSGRRAKDQARAIETAIKRLDEANQDRRHISRLRYGTTAHNAFFQLFMAYTGMNETQARELAWSGDYEIESKNPRFRTIKWRAGAKACSFSISARFLPDFKRYLQLRNFMLEGKSFSMLFVSFGREEYGKPQPVREGIQASLWQTLLTLDSSLDVIKARKLRSAKSDFLGRKVGFATGAAVLQNSEPTYLEHYTSGTQTGHFVDMSNYWGEFSKQVTFTLATDSSVVERNTGGCATPDQPEAVSSKTPVPVDCKKGEGCLFCKSYRLHADLGDALKLLSCRTYAEMLVAFASSVEEYERSFAVLFARIDGLLAQIEKQSPGVLVLAKEQVEQGEFSTYWAAKIEMLIECGVD